MANTKLKDTLLKTITSIQNNPKNADVRFKADTELIEGVKCKSKIRQFTFNVDEPEILGGTDTASNPVEIVLAALGTCQEIMYNAYAAVGDITLDSVKVKVRGDLNLKGLFGLDENTNAGFNNIYYETEIQSSADQDVIKKLISNVESHCPLLDILTRQIKVEGKVNVIKSPVEKVA